MSIEKRWTHNKLHHFGKTTFSKTPEKTCEGMYERWGKTLLAVKRPFLSIFFDFTPFVKLQNTSSSVTIYEVSSTLSSCPYSILLLRHIHLSTNTYQAFVDKSIFPIAFLFNVFLKTKSVNEKDFVGKGETGTEDECHK